MIALAIVYLLDFTATFLLQYPDVRGGVSERQVASKKKLCPIFLFNVARFVYGGNGPANCWANEDTIMNRLIAVVCAIIAFAVPARADDPDIPPDYRVACLDATTGKLLWETKPGRLALPRLTFSKGVVIAESSYLTGQQTKRDVYRFDAKTGKLLKRQKPRDNERKERLNPLKPLARNLTAVDGTKFSYRWGNTRHLIAVSGGQERIVKRLESYPHDLHIAGNLAVFTFSGGTAPAKTGGGEVHAYNLKTKKWEWEFAASTKIPDLDEAAYTSINIDGDRVLVSTDQTLFSLTLDGGKIKWMTKLPRQAIRQYDAPSTAIGRFGDVLFVQCYEDVFAVRAKDGKLLWSFDCGPFGGSWTPLDDSWPLIVGNRVFVGTRKD